MGNIYHSWDGTKLTITSDSGTSSADLRGSCGVRGPIGPAGNTAEGTGIASITRTNGDGSSGSTDTYTITLTNGQTSTFTVYNGMDGEGKIGKDGVSISTAAVDENGHLILSMSDGKAIDCGNVRGADGASGTGITHSWVGTTLYITSASGTSSVDLRGEKGEKGDITNITVDSVITPNSNNPVSSKAVYDYVGNSTAGTTWEVFPHNSATVSLPADVGMVYTKANNVVSIQGAVKLLNRLENGVSTTIGTMPVGYRPYRNLQDVRNMGGAFFQLLVNTSGEIKLTSFVEGGLSNAYNIYVNIEYIAGN